MKIKFQKSDYRPLQCDQYQWICDNIEHSVCNAFYVHTGLRCKSKVNNGKDISFFEDAKYKKLEREEIPMFLCKECYEKLYPIGINITPHVNIQSPKYFTKYKFTEGEFKVAKLLIKDYSYCQIAKQLIISAGNVGHTVWAIRKKMGVNNTEAAKILLRLEIKGSE